MYVCTQMSFNIIAFVLLSIQNCTYNIVSSIGCLLGTFSFRVEPKGNYEQLIMNEQNNLINTIAQLYLTCLFNCYFKSPCSLLSIYSFKDLNRYSSPLIQCIHFHVRYSIKLTHNLHCLHILYAPKSTYNR